MNAPPADLTRIPSASASVTAAAVAEELEVTPRTIYRDMVSLQANNVPVIGEAGVGYVQYFSDVPALLVGVHIAGSIAVWRAVLDLHLRSRHPLPETVTEVAPEAPTPASNPV